MANSESDATRPFLLLIFQGLKALGIGLLISLFLFLLSISIYQAIHINRIFPGVHIQGYPVGGMTVEEAAVSLVYEFQFNETGLIALRYLDEPYGYTHIDLGISIDAVRSAVEAYQFGRSFPLGKWIWQQPLIFARNIQIAPVVVFDENIAMSKLMAISAQEDQALAEASLHVEGTQVIATPGQKGHILDQEEALSLISRSLVQGNFESIALPVLLQEPALMDASPFISFAQTVLEQPFIIRAPQEILSTIDEWTLTPENLAPMLTFSAQMDPAGEIKPQFIPDTLDGLLDSIAEKVDRAPENPRFIFNDDTHELDLYKEGRQGFALDSEASAAAIQRALVNGQNEAILTFKSSSPEVADTATSDLLGITELVHMESSYFYGSDTARIHNIETAASEFLGILVKPGETFSMANVMNDITLDNGYTEALIIYNGKTIEGVGGGVCQVSTTLFRTAFFGGFPIQERHPHAYRVSYYEKVAGNSRDPNLAGLDATVYIPLVDLKFTNDTSDWLLMEAYVNPAASRITWKFYSTYDDRTVEWRTTGLTNKIEPKGPIYEENPELDKGEVKQVDWEAEGADVTISRIVYKNEEEYFEDSFFTRYAPWRAVYEYGPGTENMPPKKK